MPHPQPLRAVLRQLALCGLLAAMLPARAQTPNPLNEWQYSAGEVLRERFDPNPPKWDKLIGFGGELLPRFEGSDNYYFEPGPTIDIRYRNIAFFSTGEGLGWNILHSKDYRAGIALTYDLGRNEGTYYRLRGRGDISPSAAVKTFGEYVFFPLVLRGDVRYNIGGVGGWVGDVSLYLPVYGNNHFFVFAGGTVSIADQNNLQHAFGVDRQQSLATGEPVYTPGGGVRSAGIGSNATWIFKEHWFLDGVAAVTELLGPAASSPSVDDKMQFAFSISLAYDFN
jgi:outer membrane scaffolding protein for murein synthesis (MipA/OmpV family)